jgi:hypothetical protein
MGEWQMRYDDDNDDLVISFDSSLSVQQNIKEWQAVHGRMHLCKVIYERIVPSSIPRAAARSADLLTALKIGADVLHTTLCNQDL